MFGDYEKISLLLLLFVFFFLAGNNAKEQETGELERIGTPVLVVSSAHHIASDRLGSFHRSRDGPPRSLVDTRTYRISRGPKSDPGALFRRRKKRETDEDSGKKPTAEQLVSSLTEAQFKGKYSDQEAMPSISDALRSPPYSTFPVKQFDEVGFTDLGLQRRRRNDSSDSREDNSQRDKRTFIDGGGGDSGEATTTTAYWKRKKDNPQFITGRGSTPKGSDYSPPQHRSLDTARESHSMKNLDTTLQGNEIGRSNQDSYHSSTNRRTYSRQSDATTSSTPKSVYDTLDYSSKRTQDFGRAYKEGNREGRITHDNYKNRQPVNYNVNYPSYDRPYVLPSSPYSSEVVGRGVEYYHRAYEPTTGRVIYYANMPDNGRSFGYRSPDAMARNFYMHRPMPYEPHHVTYMPAPYDYGLYNGMGRPMDYMRTGRSNAQVSSYPYQERNKYQRDSRFLGGYEKENQAHDDVRNKTYIIYDAEDSRFAKPQYPSDIPRLGFGPPFLNHQGPQEGFRRFSMVPPTDYYSPQEFPPVRSDGYSPRYLGSSWGFGPNQPLIKETNNKWQISSNVNSNLRAFNSPEVQLPVTTLVNRNLPYRDSDKLNKKA